MNEHFFIFGLIIDIIVAILFFITFITGYGYGTNEYGGEYIKKSILYLGIAGFIGFILMIISPFIK